MDDAKNRLQEIFQGRGLPLPYYHVKSSGPPNCPVVECTVTVKCADGRRLCEVAEVRGKKKEAEKLAARKMLQTLQGRGGGTAESPPHRGPSLSPANSRPAARTQLESVSAAVHPTRCSPHRSPSPASPSPSGKSPVAALQERLQAVHLSPPTYIETIPAARSFRVRCQVQGGGKIPDLSTEGEGNSKSSAKEAAARDMLRKMDKRGSNKLVTAPAPPRVAKPVTPDLPRAVDDDVVASKLASLSPKYHFWSSHGEAVRCNFFGHHL